jgi:hypothetical protein
VFALLAHTDKATVNPLDLDQWSFYAVPTAKLEERIGRRRSLSLKTVRELAPGLRGRPARSRLAHAQHDNPVGVRQDFCRKADCEEG